MSSVSSALLIIFKNIFLETYVGFIIHNDDKVIKVYNCLVLNLVFERHVPSQTIIDIFLSREDTFR